MASGAGGHLARFEYTRTHLEDGDHEGLLVLGHGKGRSTLVELTAGGQAALDQICPPLIDIEEDCMATLSAAEQRQIIDLLAKIQARVIQRRAARR